jgi:predicted dithiol-disulfide oxidoreductase (DUF899 family)
MLISTYLVKGKQEDGTMRQNRIVSREEWLAARKALLVKEKEATRLRDRINAERLALPWVKVEKTYHFDPKGCSLLLRPSEPLRYHNLLD